MQDQEQPKVAVLMSVYQKECPEYLRESMESILRQSYQPLDFHIYQDGILGRKLSEILFQYAAAFPNIRLYSNPRNRGTALCMNEMIGRLRLQYPYFARMDSDDAALPERIERQVQFLESHPEIDVVGGSIIDMDEGGRELKRVRYPVKHEAILRFFRKRNPMAHVTVMYRKSYFGKAGLYPPVALEDGLCWMQGFLAGCRFENLPDFLVRVRRSDDFLRRRSGFKKGWEELKIKVHINRQLRLGMISYLYAVAMFFIQLLPLSLKKILYDRLR